MKFKKIIKYAVFAIIPLLALLVISEFALRGYYYLKLGGYRYRIDRLVDLKSTGPYYSENSSIANELGFSGKGPFDPKKIKNEYRILVLGGSGAAGTRESNWPDTMAQVLNKKGLTKTVRVINGGIGGHTSSEEKAWLTRWMELAPDLIIIYDDWNDMYFSRYLPEEYKEQFEISNRYYYPSIGRRVEHFFARHSIIVRKIKVLSKAFKKSMKKAHDKGNDPARKEDIMGVLKPISLNQANTAASGDEKKEYEYVAGKPFKVRLNWRQGEKIKTIDLTEPVGDNMSYIYETNMREMVRLARQKNIRVMLIAQPDLLYHYVTNPGAFKNEEKAMFSVIDHKGMREDWINTTKVLYPIANEIKRRVSRENSNAVGFYMIDNIFDGYPDHLSFWNTDSCHQTHDGIKIIGKHIADLVYSEIFKQGSAN